MRDAAIPVRNPVAKRINMRHPTSLLAAALAGKKLPGFYDKLLTSTSLETNRPYRPIVLYSVTRLPLTLIISELPVYSLSSKACAFLTICAQELSIYLVRIVTHIPKSLA